VERRHILDYDKDIAIDETALDVEWLEQPRLMLRYTTHAAAAKQQLDEAKEKLDIVTAKLDADIRTSPGDYGISKLTESAIQGAITLSTVYQDALQTYNKTRYEHEMAQAAVRAMDQRKTALENLVRLLTASYFAGPQVPRDLSQSVLERRSANQKVRITRRGKDPSNE
jgi:hypothetical protein